MRCVHFRSNVVEIGTPAREEKRQKISLVNRDYLESSLTDSVQESSVVMHERTVVFGETREMNLQVLRTCRRHRRSQFSLTRCTKLSVETHLRPDKHKEWDDRALGLQVEPLLQPKGKVRSSRRRQPWDLTSLRSVQEACKQNVSSEMEGRTSRNGEAYSAKSTIIQSTCSRSSSEASIIASPPPLSMYPAITAGSLALMSITANFNPPKMIGTES